MQQEKIEKEIAEADTLISCPGMKEHELINQLVLQFLQHDGYVETARAFAGRTSRRKDCLRQDSDEEIPGINIKDDEDARNRQRIRRAILEGDIDKALKYTDAYYPQVLGENEQVYFRLRCRKFVEMIRKDAEVNLLVEQRTAKARNAATDHDEIMLEVDGSGNYGDHMDTDMDAGGVSKLLQEALDYGQELRAEFGKDQRKEVTAHLEEIFALMAYQNPLKEKEVKHLLDRNGRVSVAEELNSAILRKCLPLTTKASCHPASLPFLHPSSSALLSRMPPLTPRKALLASLPAQHWKIYTPKRLCFSNTCARTEGLAPLSMCGRLSIAFLGANVD